MVVYFYLDVHSADTRLMRVLVLLLYHPACRYWIGRATAAANDDEKENFKIDGSIRVRRCAFQDVEGTEHDNFRACCEAIFPVVDIGECRANSVNECLSGPPQ